jgi:integrase
MKLTSKSVAALALPAGKRDVIHFDDTMPGFGFRLRLGSGGRVLRSWICQYRRAGATRRVLLGSAEVLGAEQARLAAKKVLGAVAMGHDPQADRVDRRGKDRLTLRGLVDDYLAAKQPHLRPRSFVEAKRYLTSGYFKPLHGMPLDTITRRDIAAMVVSIVRGSGSPTAARARGALSSFFVWAMQMGLIENNPTIGSTKPAESKPRERVLSDNELASIWNACNDDAYGKIVKLLVLTACRRAEIGNMCWSELDDPEQPNRFTIPAARSKNGKPHTLPVMPMMRDVISSVPRLASRNQLFGARGDGFTSWVQGKRSLDERSGVTAWKTHDIRRSIATKMADLGTPPHIVEEVLGHRTFKAGVRGTYNRSTYEREVRAALAMWHDHIRMLIDGGARNVIPITAATAS